MLSRDQVLHVAKLARLQLSDEEVDRYAGELSKVVDWIDSIRELGDLSDVPPTSHVVGIENRFRADVPRPCLPVEEALASAPDPGDGGFRVPSPGAGSEMSS
jgi:aspartyl-tRNA(Asn)/glutamyl-tRNA(Gln) amidotransferase subunit C